MPISIRRNNGTSTKKWSFGLGRRKSEENPKKGEFFKKKGWGIESLMIIIIKLINLQIVGWTVDLLPEKLS